MQPNLSPSTSFEHFDYQFGNLEVISNQVSVFIEKKWSSDYGVLNDFQVFIREQTDIIKDNLINSVFSIEDEHFLEKYIQYHQRALIRLAGNLLSYAKPEDINEIPQLGSMLLVQYVYQSMQELLSFIEKHFTKYFDQNAWIPSNYRRIVHHEIRIQTPQLQPSLIEAGVSKQLAEIALLPITRFVENEGVDITYQYVIYLKELKRQLNDVILMEVTPTEDDKNEYLRSILLYLNFNSPELYSYWIEMLNVIRDNSVSVEECIEQLAFYKKLIQQTPVKPGFALNPSDTPLRRQLLRWIDNEIEFQERKQTLRPAEELAGQGVDHQIAVDMSVEKLAYFFHVLVEVGIVPRKLITRTFKLIAKVFRTDRTQEMSENSFKNGFYSAPSSAREYVRNLLLKMLAFVEKDMGTI